MPSTSTAAQLDRRDGTQGQARRSFNDGPTDQLGGRRTGEQRRAAQHPQARADLARPGRAHRRRGATLAGPGGLPVLAGGGGGTGGHWLWPSPWRRCGQPAPDTRGSRGHMRPKSRSCVRRAEFIDLVERRVATMTASQRRAVRCPDEGEGPGQALTLPSANCGRDARGPPPPPGQRIDARPRR